MELIVISQSKLKIMLTPPDMQRYELAPEQLDCADEQTRRAFRHIFDDARTQIGFDTAGERLFVQLYTSRGGGCEIFVTKLGERDGILSPDQSAVKLTDPEEALLRRVLEHTDEEEPDMEQQAPKSPPMLPGHSSTRPAAVILPDMTTLLSVCHRLLARGYRDESRAYIDEASAHSLCYLIIRVPDTTFFRLPDRYAFLGEYGRLTDASALELYLCEHGRVLCGQDAVATLGVL